MIAAGLDFIIYLTLTSGLTADSCLVEHVHERDLDTAAPCTGSSSKLCHQQKMAAFLSGISWPHFWIVGGSGGVLSISI